MPQRPVRQDLGDRVIHQRKVGPDRADAHVQRVGAQFAQRQLGDVAEGRMHPGSDDATEDDELDAWAIDEDRCHVQGVRDDREAAVHEPSRELERGGAARDQDRVAVANPGGRRLRDGRLGRRTPIPGAGERRPTELGAAVRPDDPPVSCQACQVAPDRRGSDTQVLCQAADGHAAIRADAVEHKGAPRRA